MHIIANHVYFHTVMSKFPHCYVQDFSATPVFKEHTTFNPIPHNTHFDTPAVENIVRKGESACCKHFLLFSQCFLPYMALIFHFKCTSK